MDVVGEAVFLPEIADVTRMRCQRRKRLRDAMRGNGIDAAILLGNSHVTYATGAVWPLQDSGRSNFESPVAMMSVDDEFPHLFTPFPEDCSLDLDLPGDYVHGPAYLDFDEGVRSFETQLRELLPAGAVIAVDEWTPAMRRESKRLSLQGQAVDANSLVAAAKVCKTPDELAILREGLRITEEAEAEVQAIVAPGVRGTELTARFLQAAFERGATGNVLDPMWQVMPSRMVDGPWTTTGDIACPLITTERKLKKGDVLWSDAGITYGGYHSDFGRTWIVGERPNARYQAQFDKWRSILEAVLAVTKAGSTAGDLTRAAKAANGGVKPWMPHFYLGHGLGIDSAEMPFVGSDLGEAFDDRLVLVAGMVLVLEPVVWDDGAAGYRAEEIMAITEDGYIPMSNYPYDPYDY
jgi:Xaa-Pro aminopeptidase